MTPASGWQDSPVRRVAIVAIVVVTVAALFGGMALLMFSRSDSEGGATGSRAIEPAQVTTPAVDATATIETTPSVLASGPVDGASSTGTDSRFARAERVAFRLGGSLYVADEKGEGAAVVSRAASGPYALSPDGLTLAIVSEGELALFDTASGARIPVADAVDQEPVWLPDSSALLFVREDSEHHGEVTDVWRVSRDGSGLKELHQGGSPAVSRDGRTIVVLAAPSAEVGSSFAFVSTGGGRFTRLRINGGSVTAVAIEGGLVYAGVMDAAGRARVVTVSVANGHQTELCGAPSGDAAATWGRLLPSTDGRCLAADAVGDDGYSRVSILSLPSGRETAISVRRDGYLRGWSATGEWLYYIEGNSYQGEQTALMRVECDGVGRRTIVTGAE